MLIKLYARTELVEIEQTSIDGRVELGAKPFQHDFQSDHQPRRLHLLLALVRTWGRKEKK